MKKLTIFAWSFLVPLTAAAMGEADPVVTRIFVDEFERGFPEGEDPLAWSAGLSAGTDYHQFTIVTEGEYVDDDVESNEVRASYSRPLTTYWNGFIGWRGDLEADYDKHWFMAGLEGEAPFFIETSAYIFAADDRSAFRLEMAREMMITQRWVLIPELSADFHGYNDEDQGIGSGLSTLELAVRLGFEVSPQLVPYVGFSWEKGYGNTADFIRAEGEDEEGYQFLLGIHFWL